MGKPGVTPSPAGGVGAFPGLAGGLICRRRSGSSGPEARTGQSSGKCWDWTPFVVFKHF